MLGRLWGGELFSFCSLATSPLCSALREPSVWASSRAQERDPEACPAQGHAQLLSALGCPLSLGLSRAAEPELCLALWATRIPGEDWHRVRISGKSHSPPGWRPRPTWHPKASAPQWEARTGGGCRAEVGGVPGWLPDLPPSSLGSRRGRHHATVLLPPQGRREREAENKVKEERGFPVSGSGLRWN